MDRSRLGRGRDVRVVGCPSRRFKGGVWSNLDLLGTAMNKVAEILKSMSGSEKVSSEVQVSNSSSSNFTSPFQDSTRVDELESSVDSSITSAAGFTQDRLTQSLDWICHTLMASQQSKILSKIDRLGPNTIVEVWFDSLRHQFSAADLLYLIDDKVRKTDYLPESFENKRIENARGIIISRIEPVYHTRVVEVRDPKVMLVKLLECKQQESNLTDASSGSRYKKASPSAQPSTSSQPTAVEVDGLKKQPIEKALKLQSLRLTTHNNNFFSR